MSNYDLDGLIQYYTDRLSAQVEMHNVAGNVTESLVTTLNKLAETKWFLSGGSALSLDKKP